MIKQRILFPNGLHKNICKSVVICSAFVYVIYMFLSSHSFYQSQEKWRRADSTSATNISHLVFGIGASSKTWNSKRWYTQAWWRPNVTRGFVFMDRSPVEHLPWDSTYPPLRVSEDAATSAIRLFRMIEETFKEEEGVEMRWYVMADDDSVVLMDNLVDVLCKYDHNKYFYVGMNSECIVSNAVHSFGMAFGGGGYALSYPLAKAVAQNMDLCIKRYPNLYGSDHMLHSCLADLGVSLTQEQGFHQIDLHKDISGFLSSHPHSPLLSLHHLDAVDPIFPSTNRTESLNLLMKAASLDQSRLLQQSICYLNKHNWTISAAWGYAVQIYDTILPPSYLHRPRETFAQWRKGASPPYMFNARPLSTDPCHTPHVFFFESATLMTNRVTTYTRRSPRGLPTCGGARSVDHLNRIRILSPLKNLDWLQDGGRRECCDVVQVVGMDSLALKLRDCGSDEMVVASQL